MVVRTIFVVCLLAGAARAETPITTPAPGPVRVIGTQGAGCIAGAVRLPDTAPGMQAIRISRSSFWGHPATIAALLQLSRDARAAGLPDLYMDDISDPRGGPLRGGHFSHQMGIDADVWLDVAPPHPLLPPEARETIEPPSLVRADGRAVDASRWRPEHATLIRLAAGLPGVDRIFVNAAIKRRLCEDAAAQPSAAHAWLHAIRPWYGHSAHMHIRFRCPAGQRQCVDGPPVPAGDGCDASLQWWFDQLDKQAPTAPSAPAGPLVLPAACRAIMAEP
jgi:penicillin-insensitive murein endopeptidase